MALPWRSQAQSRRGVAHIDTNEVVDENQAHRRILLNHVDRHKIAEPTLCGNERHGGGGGCQRGDACDPWAFAVGPHGEMIEMISNALRCSTRGATNVRNRTTGATDAQTPFRQ